MSDGVCVLQGPPGQDGAKGGKGLPGDPGDDVSLPPHMFSHEHVTLRQILVFKESSLLNLTYSWTIKHNTFCLNT